MSELISQDQLLKLAELSSKAALRKHLKRAGIPFRELGGKLFTTTGAIDAVLVGRAKKKKSEPNWGEDD